MADVRAGVTAYEPMPTPPKGFWQVQTIVRLGNRPTQQDAYAVAESCPDGTPALTIAVADGHGIHGEDAAALAANRAVERVRMVPAVTHELLREVFRALHEDVLRLADEPGAPERGLFPGTTLTLVMLRAGHLLVAYVGDSQARLSRRGRALQTVTVPHRYCDHRSEQRRLDAAGALIDDARICIGGTSLATTRALGDGDFAPFVMSSPEIIRQPLLAEHRFLLVATDGFWDKIASARRRHRVEQILDGAESVHAASSQLEALLSRRDLADNLTVVLVDVRVANVRPYTSR